MLILKQNANLRGNLSMHRLSVRLILIISGLCLLITGAVLAQDQSEVTELLNSGFDLLAQGKINQAQGVFEQVLRRDPGNPLALNNLGTIMVQRGNYDKALSYFEQALPRAKGHKVTWNQRCTVGGVCAAYRLDDDKFGTQDLEDVIKFNILAMNASKSQKK